MIILEFMETWAPFFFHIFSNAFIGGVNYEHCIC